MAALVGCSEDTPLAGQLNGTCRVTLPQCDEGLVCRTGACRVAGDEPQPLDVLFTFLVNDALSPTLTMPADGLTFAGVRVQVLDQRDGTPWAGEVRLLLDPESAGDLAETVLTVESGIGQTRFRPCDALQPDCPTSARLVVSRADAPLVGIGVSELTLVHEAAPTEDAGAGGADGATEDAGAGEADGAAGAGGGAGEEADAGAAGAGG